MTRPALWELASTTLAGGSPARPASAGGPGRRRPDLGRMIMVPLAAGFLVFDAAALARGSRDPLHWLGTALVCGFYALMLWCYLRRGPARATSRWAVS